MSFQQGLSGLNAAGRNLNVIGNNIANANTIGMKAGRTEFAEVVASSLGTMGGSSEGIGVAVAAVTQQFSQGNINVTNNDMDVAINGAGFLTLALSDGSRAYTRDGELKLDKDGYIVTNTGANVLGYKTDLAGKPLASGLPQITDKLQLPTYTVSPAQATAAITMTFNLPASEPVWNSVTPNTALDKFGTSLTVYDSQGSPISAKVYMRKVALAGPPAVTASATDRWEVYTDPTSSATATNTLLATLDFGSSGSILAVIPDDLSAAPAYSGPTAFPTPFVATNKPVIPVKSPNTLLGLSGSGGYSFPTLDFSNATQYANQFTVSNLSQDGFTSGNLIGVRIDDNGVIMARFSNGQTQAKGQVALANFRNVQGLVPSGNNNWAESYLSGPPTAGSPRTGNLGTLRSGALEESNVDLTKELVNMMTAQRSYQANAQTIKTQDQVLSTLVNLR